MNTSCTTATVGRYGMTRTGVGEVRGKRDAACQVTGHLQTSALFYKPFMEERGGWTHTVSWAPFMFCGNLGESF